MFPIKREWNVMIHSWSLLAFGWVREYMATAPSPQRSEEVEMCGPSLCHIYAKSSHLQLMTFTLSVNPDQILPWFQWVSDLITVEMLLRLNPNVHSPNMWNGLNYNKTNFITAWPLLLATFLNMSVYQFVLPTSRIHYKFIINSFLILVNNCKNNFAIFGQSLTSSHLSWFSALSFNTSTSVSLLCSNIASQRGLISNSLFNQLIAPVVI